VTLTPHRFEHENLSGAIFQVAPDQADEPLNGLLFAEDQLPGDPRITFGFSAGVIRRGGEVILLDAGVFPKETIASLASLEIRPEHVTTVLVTHKDLDHVGGLVDENGALVFANARTILPATLWEAMDDPDFLEALREVDAACLHALRRSLERPILGTELEEILPGITYLPTPGHRTGGHAAYEITTTGTPLLYAGDALLHPVFVEKHPGPFKGDDLPDIGTVSRAELLQRSAASGALVFASHVPFPGLGRIQKTDDGFCWETASPPTA